MYSKVKELPETIQSALSALGYTRADIEIEVSESVSPFVGGDDGYRGFCSIVDIVTGQKDTKVGSWGGSNAFNPNNQVDCDIASYTIPSNVAVIKGRSGGCHPVYATITLSPDNIVKLLPVVDQLNAREKWILYVMKSLTSAGRKNEWSRYNDQPSMAELKALEARGFLKINKAGSAQITTDGKNALGNVNHVSHPSKDLMY